MATTRFSKPWPCVGIRLGATLSLWRRVHCERVAWQAWGMVRPGHRFAWQAAGIGRVGGVPRACAAGLVGGAVPWGLGSGRVARTHDFARCDRCDMRFAWQAWDSGCSWDTDLTIWIGKEAVGYEGDRKSLTACTIRWKTTAQCLGRGERRLNASCHGLLAGLGSLRLKQKDGGWQRRHARCQPPTGCSGCSRNCRRSACVAQ